MRLASMLTRAVQTRGRFPATIYADRTRTWAEVGARVERLAGALSELGVSPTDHVAILALNSDNYAEAFFGIAWAGGVSVPLNTRWSAAEVREALNDSGASILMLDDNFAADIQAWTEGTQVGTVIDIGDGPTPDGCLSYEALLDRATPLPDRSGSGDDLCSICYTGGTTATNPTARLCRRKDPQGRAAQALLAGRPPANWVKLYPRNGCVVLRPRNLAHSGPVE